MRGRRFVGPRPRSVMGAPEQGWVMVSPVYSASGDRAVLVRRGWVPDAWRRQGRHLADQQQQHSSGVGVVSNGEVGNSFVPANVPGKGEWFTLDTAEMVRTPLLHPEEFLRPWGLHTEEPYPASNA